MSRSFKVDMCEAVSLGGKITREPRKLCELPKSHLNFRLKNCTTVKRRRREDGMEEEGREGKKTFAFDAEGRGNEQASSPTHILFQEGRKKFGFPHPFTSSQVGTGGTKCSLNVSGGLKSMFMNIYEQF